MPGESEARRIRIVETYQTRLVGALVAGDPGSAEPGPRIVKLEAMWSPGEGNAGLVDRYAAFLETTATFSQQVTPFPLVPPGDANAQKWAAFAVRAGVRAVDRRGRACARSIPHGARRCRRHGACATILRRLKAGRWEEFVKTRDGAWTRARWQDFLARRYRSIGKLDLAWQATWPAFDLVALPDVLPETAAAQTDWLQFERQVLAMHRTAHRFSVLLPLASVTSDPAELERRLGLARRIVELEKPAHTIFDVRFYWAFFRVGEARLGLDTQMGTGSRAQAHPSHSGPRLYRREFGGRRDAAEGWRPCPGGLLTDDLRSKPWAAATNWQTYSKRRSSIRPAM